MLQTLVLTLHYSIELTVSAEWYNRETKDLLMDKPISAAVGVINSSGVVYAR